MNNKGCDVSAFLLAQFQFVILYEYLVQLCSCNQWLYYCFGCNSFKMLHKRKKGWPWILLTWFYTLFQQSIRWLSFFIEFLDTLIWIFFHEIPLNIIECLFSWLLIIYFFTHYFITFKKKWKYPLDIFLAFANFIVSLQVYI